MPRRSSKHATLDRRMVVPTSGMDLSMPPNAIADNMLSRAYNWWYEPERGLTVRQGLVREDVATLTNPIVAMHPYVDATGTLHLLAASGDKLYERTTTTWTEVTTVDTDAHVSMVTFNGSALIADGAASGIKKYDGTTVSTISGSPNKPMCITTIANRVVCASAATPDYVYFSGPNDLADWATSSPGAAATIAAGFGDGYAITGFAVIYDALIVSKVKRDSTGAIVGRKMYAIITTGDVSNWQVKLISSENAAMLCGGLIGVGEVAYCIDTNGFKAVSPTPNGQYGDIGVDALVGVKINKLLATISKAATISMMTYIPSLAQIWCMVGTSSLSRMVVLHPIQGAFTQVDFGTFTPRCCAEVGQKVFLAGNDGALYSLANVGKDELADGVFSNVYATLRTRTFEGLGGDLILKKTKLVLDTIRPATVLVEAWLPADDSRVSIGSVTMGAGSASTPVYEAYDLVADADYDLADSQVAYEPLFYGGPRATGMALQVRVNGGRVALNSLTAEFAVVGS